MNKYESLIRYGPIGLTLILILWTVFVSPHSKYGDNWAIYPALAIFPLAVIWHIVLVFIEKSKSMFITYGLVHLAILLAIWMYCLMKISKDSL
jgi:hypothetical protein